MIDRVNTFAGAAPCTCAKRPTTAVRPELVEEYERAAASAGGCPAATYFLCLAKESMQRQAERRVSQRTRCAARRVHACKREPQLRPLQRRASEGYPALPTDLKIEYAISMRFFKQKCLKKPMSIA
jgi:hypothetical protein